MSATPDWGALVGGRVRHLLVDRGYSSLRPGGNNRPAVALCGTTGIVPGVRHAVSHSMQRCQRCSALIARQLAKDKLEQERSQE